MFFLFFVPPPTCFCIVDFAVFFTAFLIEVCPDKTPPISGMADSITSRPIVLLHEKRVS